MTDSKKLADEMMNLADHFADTLQQPDDSRAWDHLLIYAPREAIERRMAAMKELRRQIALEDSK